jgi:Tfp pilus assembly protein PilE
VLRSARVDLRKDRGVTAVELMIVVILMGIIGSAMTNSIVGNLRASRVLQERTEALSQLELTAGRVARQLRAAAPVQTVATGPNEAVQVRTFSRGTCTRYTYRVEGTRLMQYQQGLSPAPSPEGSIPNPSACVTPAVALPPAAVTPTVLINGLGGSPLFEYRRADGSVMNFAAVPRPLERDIASIRMTLSRTIRDGGTVQVTTDIVLRNRL